MYSYVKPKAITPSDVLPNNAVLEDGTNPELLWVGASGTVTVVLPDKSTLQYSGVCAGGFILISPFTGVMTTGTTATGIIATRRTG